MNLENSLKILGKQITYFRSNYTRMFHPRRKKYLSATDQFLVGIKDYKIALYVSIYYCCICIKTLHFLKPSESCHSEKEILEKLGITYDQVRAFLLSDQESPERSRMIPLMLTSEKVGELEAFVCSS